MQYGAARDLQCTPRNTYICHNIAVQGPYIVECYIMLGLNVLLLILHN